ncbi:MAG: hypothetical protein K9H48_21460 [Melioribacteraceae bacterium]|nr:hypothetical protein [Melioribacteraceae bacterium]MCF8396464.1 hypothetical protein [Melioribacteraceae bacterium]
MRTSFVLFIAIIFSLSTQAQTTLSYHESFNDPSAFDGWLIPNPEGEINVAGGSLNLTYTGDGTEIWLIPPIAASKGDFYFRVTGSGDDMDGAGMYRKSETGSTVCYIVDDSIYIGYEYNSGAFNLMFTDSLHGIEEITSMGIGVTGTLPDLSLDVYINDEIFFQRKHS